MHNAFLNIHLCGCTVSFAPARYVGLEPLYGSMPLVVCVGFVTRILNWFLSDCAFHVSTGSMQWIKFTHILVNT